MKPPLLTTPRLQLTWPTPAQIGGYHQAILGTRIFDTLEWDGPTSDRDLHEYWEEARQSDWTDPRNDLVVAVIETSSGRCVGGMALITGDHCSADAGYALAPDVHGKGYATEGLRALRDDGFANRGLQRITAGIFVGNHASRRVAEKCGFRLEGTRRRSVLKRGQWLDDWLFAITRPDWDELRKT